MWLARNPEDVESWYLIFTSYVRVTRMCNIMRTSHSYVCIRSLEQQQQQQDQVAVTWFGSVNKDRRCRSPGHSNQTELLLTYILVRHM